MTDDSIRLPAFAKINWFLNVLERREDGFHEIRTAFQSVSLCDYLTFSPGETLELSCDRSGIPLDRRNLVIAAGGLLKTRFGVEAGAKIYLEKNIPSPGGLGGGSSDAAVALLGLAKLWNLSITGAELLEIAGTLGSDVPFFLSGGTAYATGRGTRIQPLADREEEFMLIVTPQIHVSTPVAFAKLSESRLTNGMPKSILKNCFDEAGSPDSRYIFLENDFENIVFDIEPEVKSVRDALLRNNASHALMSGSGASVFAIFENEETRQATIDAIKHETNWRCFAVATISRDSYRDAFQKVLTVVSDQFL